MRWIIALLIIVAGLNAADYPVEREASHTLTDGRVLVGVYDAQAGALVMRMPSGRTSQMPVRADQISSSVPTRDAEDRQAELRAAAAEARRQQAATELAARQRERDEKAAAIQAAEAQRQAERDRLREARETAAAYDQRCLHFDPLTMSPADMHREASRIDAEAKAKAQADALAALRAKRVADEAAAALRRAAMQRERETQQAEADQRREQADADQRADDERQAAELRRQQERRDAAADRERGQWAMIGLSILLAVLIAAGLPTIIAYCRRHPQRTPLIIVNISTLVLMIVIAAIVTGQDMRMPQKISESMTNKIWLVAAVMAYALAWIGCLAWACWPGMSRPPKPPLPAQDGQDTSPPA